MATDFPKGFLWGCATSAYQIEGSPLADGAGPSTWHRFAHTPGRIADGDTGDVACDHYRRFQSDVDLMHSLQLGAYRFSISWSRVLPQGTGRINPAGLGFYERLVDSLLARGIQPMATLYHWDLPAALDDRGGWLNPDIANWFAEYADVVFRKLDDRIQYWATLNEPWVSMNDGYLLGIHAPGHRSVFEATRAAHHLLMAHGMGGAGVSRERPQSDRSRRQHRAQVSRFQRRGRRRSDAACRRVHESTVPRTRAARHLPRGAARDLRPGVAGDFRERPCNDPPAARLHRRELLHAQRRALRSQCVAVADGRGAAEASHAHRNRLGSLSAGADGHAAVDQEPLRQSARVHHRERRCVLRSAER